MEKILEKRCDTIKTYLMSSNKDFVKESKPFKDEMWLLVIRQLLQRALVEDQRVRHLHLCKIQSARGCITYLYSSKQRNDNFNKTS